jgi:hypothetical protein
MKVIALFKDGSKREIQIPETVRTPITIADSMQEGRLQRMSC